MRFLREKHEPMCGLKVHTSRFRVFFFYFLLNFLLVGQTLLPKIVLLFLNATLLIGPFHTTGGCIFPLAIH